MAGPRADLSYAAPQTGRTMQHRSTLKGIAFAGLACSALACAESEANPEGQGAGGATIITGGAGGSTTDDGGAGGPARDSSAITIIDGAPVGSVGDASFGDACASELHQA